MKLLGLEHEIVFRRERILWQRLVAFRLPFLLAREGLTAEEVHFLVRRFLEFPISLSRLRCILPNEAKRGRKSRLRQLSLDILERIRELRDEGRGYVSAWNELRKEGVSLPKTTVRYAFKIVDELIEEKLKEEEKLREIETEIKCGNIDRLPLKRLVFYAMRRKNHAVDAEIERRLQQYLQQLRDQIINSKKFKHNRYTPPNN